MDPRTPLSLFVTLLVIGGIAEGADHPNFVWLISEDNSKHFLKLFDDNGTPTPRIEALARKGLVFERAFSNSPVCSVARTTLITSCYAPRIGTQFHRRSVMAPMPRGLRMFPAYLRRAGYYTTNRRKKDYNAKEGEGVWDASSGKADWRERASGQPFFHKQSFSTTHESSLHFPPDAMKKTATVTDPAAVFIAPYHPDTPTFRYTYARYHDRIREVDRQIGDVVDRLEADGLLEDTFIFYFGDHGGVLPRGKGYAYESGLHVPLVVRIPANWRHLVNAKRGTRVKGFVSFVDFGPTLLELAGVEIPSGIDGRPFLGKSVTLAELNRRDETFGHADRFDEKYDLVRTLRKGRFKYVRSYQPFNFDGLQNNYRYRMIAYREWRDLYRAGKLNPVERQFFEARAPEALYDIATDPHETRNLATDPAHAATLRDLRRRLTRRVKEMPDLSLFPESYLAQEAFGGPVEFGQARKADVAKLVDVADLSLVPFDDAKAGIHSALASKRRWERYWALIACSSHGKNAEAFVDVAKMMSASDPEPLVRVRAAEFLALIGAADPRPTILDVLSKTKSLIEANLVLNTLVLLRDGKPGYEFQLTKKGVVHSKNARGNVRRRLDYLNR